MSDSRRFDMLKLWIILLGRFPKQRPKPSLHSTIAITPNGKSLGIEKNMTHFYKTPNWGFYFIHNFSGQK